MPIELDSTELHPIRRYEIAELNPLAKWSVRRRSIRDFQRSQLQDIYVPFPPLETQKRIAAFLDEKTAQIDGLIEKKRALLERLAEKRQAIITQAVTKGLNPAAPMKDSGIDWLGQIPAHWEVKRLRSLA